VIFQLCCIRLMVRRGRMSAKSQSGIMLRLPCHRRRHSRSVGHQGVEILAWRERGPCVWPGSGRLPPLSFLPQKSSHTGSSRRARISPFFSSRWAMEWEQGIRDSLFPGSPYPFLTSTGPSLVLGDRPLPDRQGLLPRWLPRARRRSFRSDQDRRHG
jgi:hypothetical protein